MKEWKDVEIVEIGVEETEHGGFLTKNFDQFFYDNNNDLHVDFEKVS